jgi:predicted dehydrogenase
MIDLENHWYHRLPGGVIGETGPHIAYMSLAFLGEINNVHILYKNYLKKTWAPNDFFTIQLEGSKGICQTTLSYCSEYWKANVEILGTKARLDVDLESMIVIKNNLKKLNYLNIGKSVISDICQESSGLSSNVLKATLGSLRTGTEVIIEDFIDSIILGKRSLVSPEESRDVVRLMEMIVQKYNDTN